MVENSPPTLARRPSRTPILLTIVALFTAHACLHWFVIDDAYISYRYARNLVEGAGLVYNPGERVEGYSNLLWVLLIASGMRLGIAPEATSCGLGLATGILLLVLTWRMASDLLEPDELAPRLALLPPLLLACNRSVAAWTTSGLETRLFSCLLLLSFHCLRLALKSRTSPLWVGVALAALCLTRVDGFLPAGVVIVAALTVPERRSRLVTTVALPVAGTIVLHTLFRVAYYGDWLPNTYRAKVEGWPLVEGLHYLSLAATNYGLPLALLLSLGTLVSTARSRLIPAAMGAVVLVQLAYVTRIGGDHFEFRFLDPIWPLLAILSVCGTRALVSTWPGRTIARVAAPALGLLIVWNALPVAIGFEDSTMIYSVETEAEHCKAWREIGRWLREHAARGEVIAVRPAGAIPYESGLRTLDMLGLNDRIIAGRAALPGEAVPGHRKMALPEDIHLRARASYVLDHPDIRTEERTVPPPRGIRVGGRTFGLFPVKVRFPRFWLTFLVVSEEAAVGGRLDRSKIRTAIRPDGT